MGHRRPRRHHPAHAGGLCRGRHEVAAAAHGAGARASVDPGSAAPDRDRRRLPARHRGPVLLDPGCRRHPPGRDVHRPQRAGAGVRDPHRRRARRRAAHARQHLRAHPLAAGLGGRRVARPQLRRGRALPDLRPALQRRAERAERRAAVHRGPHRGDALGVRARHDRGAPVLGRGAALPRAVRRQRGDARQPAAVGLPAPAPDVRPGADHSALLRLHRCRHRPLRDRWRAAPAHAQRTRAQHPAARRRRQDLDERTARLHPRLRPHRRAGQRRHLRWRAALPGERHQPQPGPADRRAAALLRRGRQRLPGRAHHDERVRLSALRCLRGRRSNDVERPDRRQPRQPVRADPVRAALRRSEPVHQRPDDR